MHNHAVADTWTHTLTPTHPHIHITWHTHIHTAGCTQRGDVNSMTCANSYTVLASGHTYTHTNTNADNGDRVWVTMATAKPKGLLLKPS